MTARDHDAIVEGVTVDAFGDDEQTWAFLGAIDEHVDFPADAHLLGEPVVVSGVDYAGNIRRGLVARCRRGDGTQDVAAADLFFAAGSEAARYFGAYRRWLGLDPDPPGSVGRPGREKKHKATIDGLQPGQRVDLVVVSRKEGSMRCRLPGTERVLTVRSGETWRVAPGCTVTVEIRKAWTFNGHPYPKPRKAPVFRPGDIRGAT